MIQSIVFRVSLTNIKTYISVVKAVIKRKDELRTNQFTSILIIHTIGWLQGVGKLKGKGANSLYTYIEYQSSK